MEPTPFNIFEASIEDHRKALESGHASSVELVISYLLRIATYDILGGLNAFTVFNPHVLEEAAASDARRAQGLPPRPLEGIPYTLKDSYKYKGLTVTNGSPALDGLKSSEDAAIAEKLRAAGAILIGKTNMPPMAAGGMQRGLYGRAESPYNPKYLTAAYSSGSSNGAATSLAASMAAFGMGSETVSSGRSPASNNALVAYTPSRGVLSCRGLWPLYVTCDVPVPYARSVSDMLELLGVIAEPDEHAEGDFWRTQTHVKIPKPGKLDYKGLEKEDALRGKRIGVPKLYVAQKDSDPYAKPVTVNPEVLELWEIARENLETLGSEVIYTDFPLVTNYENDSMSGEANNVDGAPAGWNQTERSILIAKAWDDFLKQNNDPNLSNLEAVDPLMLFPKPKDYIPDTFLEVRNWINYAGLPALAAEHQGTSIFDVPGLKEALCALEAQRKRDLEDWMDELKIDCVVFPANGDVGFADLEFNLESATHSLKNGVKYSNGNRAIRHLGVPTVSVPMGVMAGRKMPVNLTFAGKAYEDERLLSFAWAFERGSKRRSSPPLTPVLKSDTVVSRAKSSSSSNSDLSVSVTVEKTGELVKLHLSGQHSVGSHGSVVKVYLDGKQVWISSSDSGSWKTVQEYNNAAPPRLGWDLKPLETRPAMVLVVVRSPPASVATRAKLIWVPVP